MGESIWTDLEERIAAATLQALGDATHNDSLTVNSVHIDISDGPPEWRANRDDYAPPFAIVWSKQADWQLTTMAAGGIVDREYSLTVYVVTAHPDRRQAAANAKRLGQRLERAAYRWPRQLIGLTDDAGETLHGFEFSSTRIATYRDDNGAWFAAAYLPMVAQTEIAVD